MRSYPCTCGRPISCHTRTDVPSGRSVGIAPWMRVVWSRLTMLVRERSPLVRQVVYGYLAEIRYSPPGLHATLRTGARCPVIAPTSVHSSIVFSSSASGGWQRHLRQPPFQPHARASDPPRAQSPPTKPPRRCPPISPKRCRLIHKVVPSFADVRTVEGDQRMREESVEVDKRVGRLLGESWVLHVRDVTPASCPMSSASKVTENS